MTIYERQPLLARAFIAPEVVRVLDEQEALARASSPDFDPVSQVVLEAPRDVLLPTGRASGEVRVAGYSPQRVLLEVVSSGGVLVLADAYYPGWRARVNQETVPIWPANVAFRGIVVPPGSHQVEFWYELGTFKVGAVFS